MLYLLSKERTSKEETGKMGRAQIIQHHVNYVKEFNVCMNMCICTCLWVSICMDVYMCG